MLNNGPVEVPRGVTVHHEGAPTHRRASRRPLTLQPTVELGVVIGKTGRDIAKSKAFDHVAGYCLAVDYTARNVQDAAKAKGLPWSAAKGFDTFW